MSTEEPTVVHDLDWLHNAITDLGVKIEHIETLLTKLIAMLQADIDI